MKPCALPILFEDRSILAVNKPAGMLSVPIKSSSVRSALTLVNSYLAQRKERAFVVHRIDRYTSGVLLFAKGKRHHDRLKDQFQRHLPERRYFAVVMGAIKPALGELKHQLKLGATSFRQMVCTEHDPHATQAVLRYKTLSSSSAASLVEIELVTGLKNQIRAQFAATGHPVVGEHQYDPEAEQRALKFPRQALHASLLKVRHPVHGKAVIIEAPLPADIENLCRQLSLGR